MNEFADRLKIIVGDRSVRSFALELDISPSTVHEYLKGRVPPADFSARVCEHFNVSAEWFLKGEGDMHGGAAKGSAGGLDKELVRVVIEAVEEGLGDLKLELKPDKKAQLVITLCEMFEEEKQVDKPTLLRLIKLAA